MQQLRIETEGLAWAPTESPGVDARLLQEGAAPWNQEVRLLRFAPGARLAALGPHRAQELYVLDGSLSLGGTQLVSGSYARAEQAETHSPDGCTVFQRSFPGPSEASATHSTEQPWLPGQGGLRLKPLHSVGSEGTALVHWPPGERFVPHMHYGGEEILVLSGTFRDEHGAYPKGTWIQSPHGSTHHPFVEEETVILVKTGHLPPLRTGAQGR